jgi:hypothetical protein
MWVDREQPNLAAKGHGFSRAIRGLQIRGLLQLAVRLNRRGKKCQGTTSVVPLETSKIAGFTGCGKTRPGGRPGIYPRHKANRIIVGFSR